METQENKVDNKPFEATPAQIAAWKKEYGVVYHVKIKDKACYLRRPDRVVLGAMELTRTGVQATELILNQCWLDGDEEIKTDDDYFVGVNADLVHIIDYERAEIKKL